LAKAQKHLDSVLRDGNRTIAERAQAYRRVSEAQKGAKDAVREANREMNEQQGMLGRFKNVLDDVAAHKGMSIFAAAVHDANIVLGDMNSHFDVLARQGVAGEMSFGQLAGATARFSGEMRLAMLNAASLGIEADDSNAAFLKLTETYGGNAQAVGEMGDKWRGMATLARMSGLGMTDVANMADQGFKRLGETMDDTLNNITLMTGATKELNQRWGEGSVNSRDFSKAVTQLAYSSGFYNQNTNMVIDTLAREINMQLALGRSREAAVQKAQKNLEMAGKVNIVGMTRFRQQIFSAYQNAEDKNKYLAELTRDFGAEGELIAHMLQKGNLMSSGNLFAFQNIVKSSTKLQQSMMEDMRVAAVSGPNALLSMGVGFEDAMRMVAESRMIADKLSAISNTTGQQAVTKMFKGREGDKEVAGLVKALRDKDKPMSRTEMVAAFYKMGGAGGIAEDLKTEAEAAKQQPWEKYVSSVEGAGWFAGVANSLKVMGSLLGQLPLALAGVLGGLLLRGPLGRMLGNFGVPGTGGGGGRLGRAAGRAAGGIGRAAGAAGRAVGGAARAVGPMAGGVVAGLAISDMVHNAFTAMSEATKLFGKEATIKDAFGVWAGKTLEHLSLGFISFTPDELKGLASGALKTPLTVLGDMLGNMMGTTGPETDDAKLRAEYEYAKAQGYKSAEGGFTGFRAAKRQKQAKAAMAAAKGKSEKTRQATTPKTMPTDQASVGAQEAAGASAGGVATATGSVSGGSLILEVSNWEDVFAQTQNDLVGANA
jgi:hypothetical protein